jgi:N-acetylglucosamine kinase-like BadF-type ATPase
MAYFLGVDIGGSKSHALLADENGQALGFGEGACGSPEILGYDGMARVLDDIIGQALAEAGLRMEAISAAGFGMAGYDWPSQRQPIIAAIRGIGLNAQLELVNDALVGLYAGSSQGWGVAVVAGTGNNCYGVNRAGKVGRVTGEGHLMDEDGGAGGLVTKAVQAVSRMWSKRGPDTKLAEMFVQRTGAADVFAFLEGIQLGWYKHDARLAIDILRVAEEGDAVAQGVINWVGEMQGDLAVGVIRQLDLQGEAFEVVMVGSLWNGGERLIAPFRRVVLAEAPRASFVRLRAAPVTGGVLLGMQQVGIDIPAVRPRLLQSWQARFPGQAAEG